MFQAFVLHGLDDVGLSDRVEVLRLDHVERRFHRRVLSGELDVDVDASVACRISETEVEQNSV